MCCECGEYVFAAADLLALVERPADRGFDLAIHRVIAILVTDDRGHGPVQYRIDEQWVSTHQPYESNPSQLRAVAVGSKSEIEFFTKACIVERGLADELGDCSGVLPWVDLSGIWTVPGPNAGSYRLDGGRLVSVPNLSAAPPFGDTQQTRRTAS